MDEVKNENGELVKLNGDGPRIRKTIASAINEVIEKDIADGKIEKEDLFNNAKIYYDNGRNGTHFDWTMNDHSPKFCVCYNGKDQLGYISVALYKTGELIGFKWLDNGHAKAEKIKIGKLSEKDTNYVINLLLQNEEKNNMFDKSIDELDWTIDVYQHDFDSDFYSPNSGKEDKKIKWYQLKDSVQLILFGILAIVFGIIAIVSVFYYIFGIGLIIFGLFCVYLGINSIRKNS